MKQFKKLAVSILVFSLVACAQSQANTTVEEELTVLTGEAEGYGGPITAEVSVNADGKIVNLVLTGEGETPEIGGKALPQLQEAILANGSIDGVDVVSGATWTSNGTFDAIRNALGIATEETTTTETTAPVAASGLQQGLGVVSTPRLGPGKDDKDTPVYSFNEVVAYVIADDDNRIVDLEVDIMEIITPNHDGLEDNFIAGWPGSSYNSDDNKDGTVDSVLEENPEDWVARLGTYTTKREQGSAYKMNSGTWEQEMDIYEEFFKGMNTEDIKNAVTTLFSDVNGRPLNGLSEKEEDVKKLEGLTAEQKAQIDTLSGATMSVNDAHGNIVLAIVHALENLQPIESDAEIAKTGLGVLMTPRLGPGKDDQEVPVYSMNVVMAGVALDSSDKVVASKVDILEIITPNHDGAEDNRFPGWPGQSYNADLDADGVVETVLEQTEDTFTESVPTFRTKRGLGSAYKMDSGTWSQEMDAYEAWFKGKTGSEIETLVADLFSDVNGRPLNGKSEREEDVKKLEGLSDDQKAEIDTLSGATMSINDAHGNMLGALLKAIANSK